MDGYTDDPPVPMPTDLLDVWSWARVKRIPPTGAGGRPFRAVADRVFPCKALSRCLRIPALHAAGRIRGVNSSWICRGSRSRAGKSSSGDAVYHIPSSSSTSCTSAPPFSRSLADTLSRSFLATQLPSPRPLLFTGISSYPSFLYPTCQTRKGSPITLVLPKQNSHNETLCRLLHTPARSSTPGPERPTTAIVLSASGSTHFGGPSALRA